MMKWVKLWGWFFIVMSVLSLLFRFGEGDSAVYFAVGVLIFVNKERILEWW